MSEFTPIERMTVGDDGSVRVEMGYTPDMLDKMAALISREVDEELMKRIAPQFGYVKERTCTSDEQVETCHLNKVHSFYFDARRCDNCWNIAVYDSKHEPRCCPYCGAKVVEE